MGQYAKGGRAKGECDRCGFTYKLKELKTLVIKATSVNIKVCPECFEKDHPQLSLGMYIVQDAQALRDPRPDNTRFETSTSRSYQYGFNPVGLGNEFDLSITNKLIATGAVGTVTVTITTES